MADFFTSEYDEDELFSPVAAALGRPKRRRFGPDVEFKPQQNQPAPAQQAPRQQEPAKRETGTSDMIKSLASIAKAGSEQGWFGEPPVSVQNTMPRFHPDTITIPGAEAINPTQPNPDYQPEPTATPSPQVSNFVPVPDTFAPMIAEAATKHGVPREILTATLANESGFNPDAQGKLDEVGIAQFRPGTAKDYNIDPRNPGQSIDAAARYLRHGHQRTGSWEGALASYNRGFGNIPMNPGGLDYVKKVLGLSQYYR